MRGSESGAKEGEERREETGRRGRKGEREEVGRRAGRFSPILDDEIHQGQGGLVGDSDSQVQGELSRCLPLGPWQWLSKVLPISEGLQHRQEIPVANGCTESLRLRGGPPGKPVFHILGHNIVPAGAPAKNNRGMSEQGLFPPS